MVETNINNNDILNIKYLPLNNIILHEIYPIYSINIKEGNYQSDELIDTITSTMNSLNIKNMIIMVNFLLIILIIIQN